jgi:RNA polymerase sigma factor (sigma-70 family)
VSSIDWEVVYRDNYQALVRFLHRKVWDADRAQDLAQETFARALGKQPENPRAWLFRVASNLANDEARSEIRRKKHLVLIQGDAEAKQDDAPDVAEEFERREQVHAVREALEQLTERDRNVLLMWDAGMNYEEIAAASGLAAGAVGTTLARARRRLVDAYGALENSHAARR